jgi:CubicO group peptidase (beta-lactamase class C family)
MRRMFLVAVALSALAAAPDPAASPDPKAKVDSLFQEFDRSDSPGCALGVFRDGKVVYAHGYGMANLELGVANSPQTVFDIGSTSKQFSAFAIQLLARDGKLSLDDDIRKWVPEIPSYGKTVTIRHLLHHTGGLRDYIELMSLQGVMAEDLSTDADVLDIMSLQKGPNFAPGEEYVYCNTGYFLLSVIVKRASDKSLRDFASERIFAPLGMNHTQFNDSHTRIIPGRATGYSKAKDGGFGIDMSDWEQTGDGSVLTTIEDLLRWDQNFYDPKVGDAKLLEAMLTTGVLNSGKKLDYASALRVSTYRGLPAISHGGSWAGYRAQLVRFPEQRFSVACLCNNGGTANPSRLAHQVAEVYLGGLMKKEDPVAEAKKSEVEARPAPSRTELQRFVGAYRNAETGQLMTLSIREGKLAADVGGTAYTLVATAPNRFRLTGGPSDIRSEAEFDAARGTRSPMRVTTTYDDGEVETESFAPVERWTPTAAELGQLAGKYASAELDTTWRLAEEGGKLYIRHRGMPDKPLEPTVTGVFTLAGMNLAFTRDAAGKPSGFVLDAGRVRGVTFVAQSL